MEKIDKANQAEPPLSDSEDEEMIMKHVMQGDHELMYLHVCLSELLCPREKKDIEA